MVCKVKQRFLKNCGFCNTKLFVPGCHDHYSSSAICKNNDNNKNAIAHPSSHECGPQIKYGCDLQTGAKIF